MRAFKRYARAGFTLVELMIVVAIIGILAALAIYGVRRYLQSAKSGEARNSIGAIVRGGIGAFERENSAAVLLAEGASDAGFAHDVCGDSTKVPTGTPPAGKKYQPSSASGSDYEAGSATTGWKCLKFTLTNPHYYQYGYTANTATTTAALNPVTTNPVFPAVPTKGFLAYANGDLDGDSIYSGFYQTAEVNTTTRAIKAATQLAVSDEFE